MKKTISTDRAPKAIGPYSQANVSGGFVFCSGQGPLDPATNKLVEGDIAAQTERVLENLKAVLEASGSSLERVVKVSVFMKDLSDFRKMNEVYVRYFPVKSAGADHGGSGQAAAGHYGRDRRHRSRRIGFRPAIDVPSTAAGAGSA